MRLKLASYLIDHRHLEDAMKKSGLVRLSAVAVAILAMAGSFTGCMAVGYSSGSGWFVWPGGLGLVLIVLLVLLVLRRR